MLSGNYFTLANMPNDFWLDSVVTFIYAPQHVLQISTSSPGIDLSEQNITKNGATTNFVWKKKDGSSLQLGKGTTPSPMVQLSSPTSHLTSIYCEMTHAVYPDFEGKNVFKLLMFILLPSLNMSWHHLPQSTRPIA